MLRTLPLTLALCACRTVTPAAPPPEAAWEAPLRQTAEGLVVQAEISGVPTLLLVDTAAKENTLQGWFFDELKVEPAARDGRKVASVAATVGGNALNPAPWTLVETNPALRALGIGGTLSPQHAVERGAVALDLPRARLVVLGGKPNLWLRWLDERSPRGQVESLVRQPPHDGRVHVLSRVGDGKEVVTGLSSAQPRSSYEPALFSPGLVVEGTVKGLHLRVGESEFGPLEIDAADGSTARLGLDVLQRVVLLVPVNPMLPVWMLSPRE